MRVPLVVLMLLAVATPALAHHDNALDLTNLVVTFNPLTQAAEYNFTITNDAFGPTGALVAWITAHDDMQPRTNVPLDSRGLLSSESKDLTLSMPLYVAVNGCITVVGTGPSHKFSNRECAMTKGATQAPLPDAPAAPELPGEDDLPAAPDLPGEDDVPPAPELPPAEPPTLP